MSLLPSEPDTSAAEEADPRVIGVDSEDADEVLSAMTSSTARELLAELHEEPAPPSRLADRVDTSLQNAQYHLENLEEAGAIEVIDTAYSEKGREMDVYAPTDRPLVIFAGREEQTTGLRSALSQLLGSLGILALASVAVQQVFGDGIPGFGGGGDAGSYDGDAGGGAGVADNETATATPTDTATPVETTTAADGGDGGGLGVAEATETATPSPEPTATPTPQPTEMETEATRTATERAAEAAGSGVAEAAAGLPPGVLFFAGGATALVAVTALWYVSR